jgi:hypothetical protein
VYVPGFFSTNSPAWRKAMRPERFRTASWEDGGAAVRPENFPERLYTVLQWLRRADGTPRCEIAFDASGGDQAIDSCAALAAAYATCWGFTVHTEGHPYPRSALGQLPSITTAWSVLESPTSYWSPPAPYAVPPETRAVLLSNDSGIGSPRGCYQPGRPVGMFGRDHRSNFVPLWRAEGRVIYVPVHDMARDGTPPAYWTATP